MLSLCISTDRGATYQIEEHGDSLEALNPRMCYLDFAGEHWVVRDDAGETVEVCAIHKAVIRSLGLASEAPAADEVVIIEVEPLEASDAS